MEYRVGPHTKYKIEYHFVWITKYRYQVLNGDVALRVRELVRQICSTFEIEIIRGVVSKDHVHVLLSSMHSNKAKRPVLIIDEAHEMRRDTVRIIKLLTNFEMDSKLIVGLVIAGQPPLRRMLLQDELSDIAQRIYHHEELRLLSKDESYDYLRHRCDMAGLTVFPFDQKACVAIYEITRGNMRAMDNLALKSLEIAENKKIEAIDETIVTLARKKLWL